MAKKPVKVSEDEMDVIERGMAAAREYEEGEKDVDVVVVVPVGQRRASPSRPKFDHTGVQPPVEPEVVEQDIEEDEKGAEGQPMMMVTITRSLTMGDVVHPEGAVIHVPVVYAEMLIKSGAAVASEEQPRPPGEPAAEVADPDEEDV